MGKWFCSEFIILQRQESHRNKNFNYSHYGSSFVYFKHKVCLSKKSISASHLFQRHHKSQSVGELGGCLCVECSYRGVVSYNSRIIGDIFLMVFNGA